MTSRFLDACRRRPTDVRPVWFMRQAGRYMKSYRDIRARHSMLEMCKRPDLAAAVTIQPVEALDVDMADWWTPTPAHYLENVPKAKMVEAVTEACGEAEARDLLKMKKGEAIAAAAAKLEGKRWLPAPLRRVAETLSEEQDAE